MKEVYERLVNELLDAPGANEKTRLEFMRLERLDRIASALEGINSNLAEIAESLNGLDENINGCISANGKNQFLCITGNIGTY